MTVQELLVALAVEVGQGNGEREVFFSVQEGRYNIGARNNVEVYVNTGGSVTIRATDKPEMKILNAA